MKEYKVTSSDIWVLVSPLVLVLVAILSAVVFGNDNSNNDGDNNHCIPKDTVTIETTDTLYDTIYIQVPDQNAYNIGYFDGNFDAQNGNIVGVDND